MKEVTQNLIYKLVSDKIIEREEAEVYIFGLQQMLKYCKHNGVVYYRDLYAYDSGNRCLCAEFYSI